MRHSFNVVLATVLAILTCRATLPAQIESTTLDQTAHRNAEGGTPPGSYTKIAGGR